MHVYMPHKNLQWVVYTKCTLLLSVCVCVCAAAHSSEVLQVVERANKEVAIEALLNTFEEVWLSRQLDLTTSERQPLAIKRQEVCIHTCNVVYSAEGVFKYTCT